LLLEKESTVLFAFRKTKHLTTVSLKKRMFCVIASPLFKDIPSPRYWQRTEEREKQEKEKEKSWSEKLAFREESVIIK